MSHVTENGEAHSSRQKVRRAAPIRLYYPHAAAMGGTRKQKKKKKARRPAAAAADQKPQPRSDWGDAAGPLSRQRVFAPHHELPEPEPEPEPEPAPAPAPAPEQAGQGPAGELRVVSYNILAQSYFDQNERQQAPCPQHCRSQGARHSSLMVEIDTMVGASDDDGGATVLCLQEVEEAYLEATLRPALADRGCGSLAHCAHCR